MDSRKKIAGAAEACDISAATYVIGYFDPMLAAHAERLAELPGPVAVLLAEPPDPLLPARSRAELAAGLRGVSVVVMPHEDGQPVTIEGGHVVDEREAHLKLRQELIERVHQRHQ